MNSQPIRPSRLWYGLAGGLLAGTVICIVLGIYYFSLMPGKAQQLQRVTVPGQARVTFTEPGRYVVYIEGPGVSEGPSIGTVNVLLHPLDNGSPIAVSPSQGSWSSYNMAGREGRSIGSFRVDHPGTYVLAAGVATEPGITHVAVGRDLFLETIFLGVALLLIGFLFLGAALAVGVPTAVLRHYARRAPQRPLVNVWPAPTAMPGPQ